MRNILAVIPARGGSIRLPQKNLQLVGGVSLVTRAIEQAKASKYILRIVVSSDDDEILDIARHAGAEGLKRPPSLSRGDLSGLHILLEHVIDTLEKHGGGTYRAGIIVILQPTSPLRTSEDIDACLDLYQSGECDSITSVCNGKENGAVYVTHANLVRAGSIYGQQLKRYEMPEGRSIDVDDAEDLAEAERILEAKSDHSGVLHQLDKSGHGAGDDKKRKGKRGRPSKIPTI